MTQVRQHVWISGKVQGVCFRAYAQKEAIKLGLKGWVRNLSDGRVEGIFEGDEQKVKSILAWCEKGSPWSQVTDVEIQTETWVGETGFDIVG